MTATTLALLAASVGVLVGAGALVRRGRASNAACADAIAGHVAVTGEHPTVAEWRAGRLRAPQPEPVPVPAAPVTVTVSVVEATLRELAGGAR